MEHFSQTLARVPARLQLDTQSFAQAVDVIEVGRNLHHIVDGRLGVGHSQHRLYVVTVVACHVGGQTPCNFQESPQAGLFGQPSGSKEGPEVGGLGCLI